MTLCMPVSVKKLWVEGISFWDGSSYGICWSASISNLVDDFQAGQFSAGKLNHCGPFFHRADVRILVALIPRVRRSAEFSYVGQ